MRQWNGWRIAVVLASAATVAGVAGAASLQVPAGAPPAAAAPAPDVSRLSAEAARMYAAVRTPRPGELGWQQIPWGVDLQEAIRVAREDRRPLLLFVSGDDPLEKC
jgi:hypothetical protein